MRLISRSQSVQEANTELKTPKKLFRRTSGRNALLVVSVLVASACNGEDGVKEKEHVISATVLGSVDSLKGAEWPKPGAAVDGIHQSKQCEVYITLPSGRVIHSHSTTLSVIQNNGHINSVAIVSDRGLLELHAALVRLRATLKALEIELDDKAEQKLRGWESEPGATPGNVTSAEFIEPKRFVVALEPDVALTVTLRWVQGNAGPRGWYITLDYGATLEAMQVRRPATRPKEN